MSFLQVEGIRHGYTAGGMFSKRHRVEVLQGLNLELIEGQNLGLLGSSGSGKSTLARLLMGLETPEQGRIIFRGEPLQGPDKPFLQQVVASGQVAACGRRQNPRPTQWWPITARRHRTGPVSGA